MVPPVRSITVIRLSYLHRHAFPRRHALARNSSSALYYCSLSTSLISTTCRPPIITLVLSFVTSSNLLQTQEVPSPTEHLLQITYKNLQSLDWYFVIFSELMVQRYSFILLAALSLLGLLPRAFGYDSHAGDSVGMGGGSHVASILNLTMNTIEPMQPSYFAYSDFSGLMLAHIVSMTIAWFFILPVGKLYCSASNGGSRD